MAALLVPGSRLRIAGVGLNPLRCGLFATLREMGADLRSRTSASRAASRSATWSSRIRAARGGRAPERAPSMIDEYPVLAVAAAFAAGSTRMRGLKELRVKESDRLTATAALLSANGVRVEIEGDDLIVHGTAARRPAAGGATHMDHRLAMSALVLGLATREPVRGRRRRLHRHQLPGFRRAA